MAGAPPRGRCRVLASHYRFTDEELEFIINYDLKYRMGEEAAGEDDGG